jgi:hypothetical protein
MIFVDYYVCQFALFNETLAIGVLVITYCVAYLYVPYIGKIFFDRLA